MQSVAEKVNRPPVNGRVRSEYYPNERTAFATLKCMDSFGKDDWDTTDIKSTVDLNPLYLNELIEMVAIKRDDWHEQQAARVAHFRKFLAKNVQSADERVEIMRIISEAFQEKRVPEPMVPKPRVQVQVQGGSLGERPALALALKTVPERSFTLADISQKFGECPDHWPGWFPSSCCIGVAAKEGCGKTIFEFDMARRVYHGLKWPDGADQTFPKGSRVLIVAADHNFWQMKQLAEAYKIPKDAILFSQMDPEDITSGTDLDDPTVRDYIELQIKRDKPVLVWVDTLGASTSKNMSLQNDCASYFNPMKRIAARTNTSIIFNTHLASGGDAIGKRLYAHCRSVLHITEPNSEQHPDLRKIWVRKTTGPKPDPIAMTITTAGCQFDDSPPADLDPKEAEKIKTQKPRSYSREFLLELVTVAKRIEWCDAVKGWEATGKPESTLRFARDGLVNEGVLKREDGPCRSVFLSFP